MLIVAGVYDAECICRILCDGRLKKPSCRTCVEHWNRSASFLDRERLVTYSLFFHIVTDDSISRVTDSLPKVRIRACITYLPTGHGWLLVAWKAGRDTGLSAASRESVVEAF